jgi:hypothetical protein
MSYYMQKFHRITWGRMALAFTVFFTVSGSGLVLAGTKPATYPTPDLAYISGSSSINHGQSSVYTFNVTFSDNSMVPFTGPNIPVTFSPSYTVTGGGFKVSNSSTYTAPSVGGGARYTFSGDYNNPSEGTASVLASKTVIVN